MSNYWLEGTLGINSLQGTMTPQEVVNARNQANTRSSDAAVRLLQGINDIPRAVTGLATAGQWVDTNPFVQTNNYLQSKIDNGRTYQPTVIDNLIQWGIRETPQILVGRGLSKLYNKATTVPTGTILTKAPSRFNHPVELYWNAGAEVGKGLNDPNISTQDALTNGALNLIPFAGGKSTVARTALGAGGELLEEDNSYDNKALRQQWGITE